MAKSSSQRRTSKKPRSGSVDGTANRDVAKAAPPAEHVAAVTLSSARAGAAAPGVSAAAVAEQPPDVDRTGQNQAGARSRTPSSSRSATGLPPAARPDSPRWSPAGLIAAGLVGGLVVLAGTVALQWDALGQNEQIAALTEEVQSLRQSLGEVEAAAADAATTGNGDDAAVALNALDERVAALEGAASEAPAGGIEEQVMANAAALEELREQIASAEGTAGDLAGRVDAIEAEIDDTSVEGRVALAFAAAELKSAIDRGGSFAPELEAFATVAPENSAVETLGAFAEEGVPTQQMLIERFPDVAREMLNAVNVGQDGGVLDRLMTSAMSVVSVRPTGQVEGETPEAIIARMENRIVESDLEAAVTEWETLPEAAKAVSQGYIGDVQARAEAENVLEETLSAASQAVSEATN